jgi:hypothetical protein
MSEAHGGEKPMSRPLKNDRRQQRHGLYALERVVADAGAHWLDALGDTGTALRDWRDAIINDLGGPEAVSSQERAIVELATKTYLMVESIDRFLLAQPSLVNKSRRQLFPVVLQRQQVADSLARYMTMLGLKRRSKAMLSLSEYLAARAAQARTGQSGDRNDEAQSGGSAGAKPLPDATVAETDPAEQPR